MFGSVVPPTGQWGESTGWSRRANVAERDPQRHDHRRAQGHRLVSPVPPTRALLDDLALGCLFGPNV